MKSILAWVFALSALALTIGLLLATRSPTDLPIEPPRRASAAAAPAPDLLSDLNVDLSIGIDTLRAALDTFVPRSFSGTEQDPIGPATDDSLTWSLSIGEAELGARDGALAFRIPITDGTVRITGRVGARRKNKGALGWLEKIAGFDIDETIEFDGAIAGTLRPALKADWTIDPGLRATVSLSKAEAALFGRVLKISFRDAIRARIDAQVRKQSEQLQRQLASDDRLATTIQRVWDAMHAVTVLSSDPPVWMTWQPVALAASRPSAQDDTVSVTLGTTVRAAIEVAPQPPVVELRPLAAPTSPREGGRIALRIPVTMRLDRFDSVAPASIGLPAVLDRPEGEITIRALSIFGAADALTVAVDVSIRTAWASELDATLYVTGTPMLDRQENVLKLADARYDVNTRSALLGVADFLLQPQILREIEQRSVFRILEAEQELLARARVELDEIESSLPGWVDAALSIDSGQLVSVVAQDGWLVAVLEVTGSARARIVELDALFE